MFKNSSTKISFKRAQQHDLDFLLSLRIKTMSEYLIKSGFPNTDDYHLSRINDSFNSATLIMLGTKRIGVLTLEKFHGRLHIAQLQLLPEYQNKGLGTKLLVLVQNKAKKLGVALTLNVMLVNPAKALYLRLGFKIVSQTSFDYQMKYQVDDNTL